MGNATINANNPKMISARVFKPNSEVAGVISWILATDYTDFTDFRMHQRGLGIISTTSS